MRAPGELSQEGSDTEWARPACCGQESGTGMRCGRLLFETKPAGLMRFKKPSGFAVTSRRSRVRSIANSALPSMNSWTALPGTRSRHARKRIAIDDAILNDHVASDIDERGVSAQFLQNVVAVVGGVQDHQDLLALHAARDLRDDLRTGRTAEQKVDLTSRDPSLGPGRALVLDYSPSARFGLDGPLG